MGCLEHADHMTASAIYNENYTSISELLFLAEINQAEKANHTVGPQHTNSRFVDA